MSLFTRVNAVSNDLSLPIIPDSEVDYFMPLEPSSYEHWIFSGGESSLVGIANGRVLTKGAIPPVFGGSYVSLSSIIGGQLTSTKLDARDQTLCVVYRRPKVSTLRYLAGTMDTTAGSSLYATGAALGSVYANQRPSAQLGPVAAPGTEGSWVFAALSEKGYPASKDQTVYVGGLPTLKSNVAPKVLVARFVALCNGYAVAGEAGSSVDFAEFILFDRTLSDAELAAVYSRSKERLGELGVTVS